MYWPFGLSIGLLLLLGGVLFQRHMLVYKHRFHRRLAIKVSLIKTSLVYVIFAPIFWGIDYGLNALLPDHWLAPNLAFLAALGAAYAAYAGTNILLNRIWGL